MASFRDPVELSPVRIPERIAISPMRRYPAHDDFASDRHAQHVGRLASSGAGPVPAIQVGHAGRKAGSR